MLSNEVKQAMRNSAEQLAHWQINELGTPYRGARPVLKYTEATLGQDGNGRETRYVIYVVITFTKKQGFLRKKTSEVNVKIRLSTDLYFQTNRIAITEVTSSGEAFEAYASRVRMFIGTYANS